MERFDRVQVQVVSPDYGVLEAETGKIVVPNHFTLGKEKGAQLYISGDVTCRLPYSEFPFLPSPIFYGKEARK